MSMHKIVTEKSPALAQHLDRDGGAISTIRPHLPPISQQAGGGLEESLCASVST